MLMYSYYWTYYSVKEIYKQVKNMKYNARELICLEKFTSCAESPFWHITIGQVFPFKSNERVKADAGNQ